MSYWDYVFPYKRFVKLPVPSGGGLSWVELSVRRELFVPETIKLSPERENFLRNVSVVKREEKLAIKRLVPVTLLCEREEKYLIREPLRLILLFRKIFWDIF